MKGNAYCRCLCLCLAMVLCLPTAWAAERTEQFSGGSGTAEDPWRIDRAEQLVRLSELVNQGEADYRSAHYCLSADINMADVEDLLAVDFREPERLLDDVVYCNRGTAIRRDGTLYAWGQNDYGQLGTEPDEDYHETPQRMAEHVRCAVMNQRSLTYLTEDDQVYTVGWNFVSSIDGVTDWGEPCDEHGQAPCYLPHQMIFENTAED